MRVVKINLNSQYLFIKYEQYLIISGIVERLPRLKTQNFIVQPHSETSP